MQPSALSRADAVVRTIAKKLPLITVPELREHAVSVIAVELVAVAETTQETYRRGILDAFYATEANTEAHEILAGIVDRDPVMSVCQKL